MSWHIDTATVLELDRTICLEEFEMVRTELGHANAEQASTSIGEGVA